MDTLFKGGLNPMSDPLVPLMVATRCGRISRFIRENLKEARRLSPPVIAAHRSVQSQSSEVETKTKRSRGRSTAKA